MNHIVDAGIAAEIAGHFVSIVPPGTSDASELKWRVIAIVLRGSRIGI